MNFAKLITATGFVLLLSLSAGAQSLDARSIINQGNKLFSNERYELAIKEYELVSPKTPEAYARATYNIGVCYYELWRTVEAIDYFQRAIELDHQRYPSASFALGVALEDEQRFTEAKAAYLQTIEASAGKHGPALFKLGVLAANEGRIEEAARLFQAAVARPGKHKASSHNNLGVMLAQMGQLNAAETEFLRALKSGNESPEAIQNLKLCQLLLLTTNNMSPSEELRLSTKWQGGN